MRVAGLLLLVALGALPAHALTLNGTVPAMGDSSLVCGISKPVPKSGPVVWYFQLEGQGGAVVWRDSVSTQMGSTFSVVKPDPPPGAYVIRSWGRRPQSPFGCDTTISWTLIDRCPPAKGSVSVGP